MAQPVVSSSHALEDLYRAVVELGTATARRREQQAGTTEFT